MEARASSFIDPLIPVTPPPDHATFRKPSLPPPSHLKRKASGDLQSGVSFRNARLPTPQPTSNPTCSSTPTLGQPQHRPAALDGKKGPSPAPSTSGALPTPNLTPNFTPQHQPPPPPPLPQQQQQQQQSQQSLDPRYVAMVSRIAAYYQQRSQAISNAQQQRCQAWASAHRQKCQDTMQAAMLVVAWYIRDRISRRRRKQKRAFRAGLRAQAAASRSKVTKGESVRRWVMKLPKDVASPHVADRDRLADQQEASFSMDRDAPPTDKDAKLFETADHLIRSQYKTIDVPLLGVLSFDESDSETEEDEPDGPGAGRRWDPAVGLADELDEPLEDEAMEEEEADYEDDGEYDYDYEDGADDEDFEDDEVEETDGMDMKASHEHYAMDSRVAHKGTDTPLGGSHANKLSQSS